MSATVDYEPLWCWVREREQIRLRKERGDPPPWTEDPILASFRFCCVRREDDRVTRWVREHVREPYAEHPLLWLMLCLCRQVNWPDTLAELIETSGAWPAHDDYSPARLATALRSRRTRGDKVYTGAYVIPAPRERGGDKQRHVAEVVIGALYHERRRAALEGWFRHGLQRAHGQLRQFCGWGDFLAYQAVVDMRFCPGLLAQAPDRASWAAAGPGSIRGLNRLYGRPVEAALPQARALEEMLAIYALVERETGVAIDLSDVPNILCETDKYLRTLREEGHPRARYIVGRGW